MWSIDGRRARILATTLLAFLATGCIEYSLREAIRPTKHELAPIPPPAPPTEGAIWRGVTHSGSFLSYDRKARGVGDLVTVVIFEDISAEGSANTTLDNSSSFSADLTSDIGFTDLLQEGAEFLFGLLGIGNAGGNAPAGTTVNVVDSNRSNEFEGDGETNRESRFRGTVTCQIVDVHPGGVFEIWGRREILINHELQLVTIAGLVRRQDVDLDNRVQSSLLANAKLTFDGIGVIDDKQRPSLLARLMDWVYPF
jgi:flagellar L-ring protein precursor FlgH